MHGRAGKSKKGGNPSPLAYCRALKLLVLALREEVEHGSTHLKAWKPAMSGIRRFLDHFNDFQR